jgi:branched-chain amino acid transport system ATP-binding protein
LLIEQNASLALSLSNKGYVLETGKVVIEGNAKELQDNEHVRKAYLGIT